MSNGLWELTQHMQQRFFDLASLMWESAGRQHGMAMKYWLQAETDVLSTWQIAAERLTSTTRASESASAEDAPLPPATEFNLAPSRTAAAEASEPTPVLSPVVSATTPDPMAAGPVSHADPVILPRSSTPRAEAAVLSKPDAPPRKSPAGAGIRKARGRSKV